MTETNTSSPTSTSEIINTLFEARERKRILDAESKKIEASIQDMKLELISRMQTENIHGTSTDLASVTLTESVVPNVTDWDVFYSYIKENDAFYMLERRASSTAWRELHQAGLTPPGTEPFTKFDISLRKR